ncbi:hypothetical protein AC579_8216 [Pseudocercospora musae]|uniref:Uncharacterized protein n=1 Tax=Pseudocercospora musae TaxID=113226 RepID=A0A139IVM0_9PEZI|nr:hypothetical protein AC579_8216 [Pseudocercospora musae]
MLSSRRKNLLQALRILCRRQAYPNFNPVQRPSFSVMSWMDSWSRPSANSKVPAPLYLSNEDVPYCRTCGRVMNSKKAVKKTSNEIKYCSDRCRSRKPGALDRRIESTIASMLNDEAGSGIEKTSARTKLVKGDPRLIVTMDEIEEVVFGSRFDPEKVYGRRKNRKSRAIPLKNGEWKSVDMESDTEDRISAAREDDHDHDHISAGEDTDGSIASVPSVPSVDGGVRIRPPQEESEINFAAGGGERGRHEKIEETPDDLLKRREGAKKAEEREMVRRAARRIIIFGVEVPKRETYEKKASKAKSKGKHAEEEDVDDSTTETRKAEALMAGMVVEPSFAKGNWAVRWRD